jgi:hypothetical protein
VVMRVDKSLLRLRRMIRITMAMTITMNSIAGHLIVQTIKVCNPG